MSEFTPVSMNGGAKQLYLPAHVAQEQAQQFLTAQELSVNGQEMKAQIEVLGTDGHGSIRAEGHGDSEELKNAEELDNSIRDMLNPKNIIDLKASLDHKTDRNNDESNYLVDKRLDKDGVKNQTEKERREELKAAMIDRYTQIGVAEGDSRNVPQSVIDEISKNVDLTYAELEKRMQKLAEKSLKDRLNDVPDHKPGEGLPWENPQADDDFMNKSLKELFDDNNPELPKDLLENGVLGDDAVRPTDPTQENPEVPTPVDQGPEVIKLPENLQKDLDASRAEYVRLSAKRSGLIFGRRNKKELAAAEAAYNKARDDAGAFVAEQMKATGNGEKEIGLAAIQGKMLEGHELAHNIYDAHVKGADEKKLKGFYEFWARQGTGGKFFSRGNAVKGATMTGIGFVPGIVAGAAGVALLGPIAGALAGGYVGRSVARGLMGAKINKEADAVRVAAEQRDASIAQTDAEAFATAGAADTLNTAQITESITARTEAQRKRNRNRAVAGVLISAAAGAAGAAAASHIPNPFGGSRNGKITMIDKKPTPKVDTGRPTLPGGSLTEAAPVAPKAIDITASDARLPWTHVTERIGQNGTPKIFEAVEKGRAMGIDIVGKGRGLESVTYNGVTYTDNAHINGALDYILNNS